MNIFVLDDDFEKNAEFQCDRHVVKMITEQNQILSTCHWMTGGSAKYKPTHVNHPCNVWVRESLDNYVWLCWSTSFLCREYSHRYGRTHAGENIVKELSKNFPELPIKGLTSFAQAMPEHYKNENAVIAYRNYYMGEKRHIANWKNREVPEWFE